MKIKNILSFVLSLLIVVSSFAGVIATESGIDISNTSLRHSDVDIYIEPKYQTIMNGESAKYEITIRDNHPIPTCDIPFDYTEEETSESIQNEVACIHEPKYYRYKINVRNLPFAKEYPRSITLQSGEKKQFTLVVGTDIRETYIDEEVQESKEEIVYTTSETEVKESVQEDNMNIQMDKVSTTQEDIEEVEAYIISEHPTPSRYARDYKFTVEAIEKYTNTRARDYAVLTVKNKIIPPPLPRDRVNIALYKGWNLVTLPGKPISFASSNSENQKLVGFVWLKEKQDYATLQEAQRILGSNFQEYLAKNSIWIYSYQNHKLIVEVNKKYDDRINLYDGWNLLPIKESTIGIPLYKLMDDCEINKLYKWDAEDQEWDKLSREDSFSKWELNYGFVAKVNQYCTLNNNPILVPPTLPEYN